MGERLRSFKLGVGKSLVMASFPRNSFNFYIAGIYNALFSQRNTAALPHGSPCQIARESNNRWSRRIIGDSTTKYRGAVLICRCPWSSIMMMMMIGCTITSAVMLIALIIAVIIDTVTIGTRRGLHRCHAWQWRWRYYCRGSCCSGRPSRINLCKSRRRGDAGLESARILFNGRGTRESGSVGVHFPLGNL